MRLLIAAALALAPLAAPAQSALDRAYDEVVAARMALERAQEAKRAGEEVDEGDREGIVTPAYKRPRSRLTDEYWERQKRLDDDLARARRELDEALKRWNALK